MNLKEIKDMINLMNENNLVEFELEKEGLRIRLKKSSANEYEHIIEKIPGSASAALGADIPGKGAPPVLPEKRIEIKSPMVGTFYRTPSPEASPFVDVGSVIEPGQVVCIIEAMKLMNEIKSEVKGKVVDILIENGEPAEFGQVLFIVEPA